MTKHEKKLKCNLGRLGINDRQSIIVGVSGGPDSVALLDALVRLRKKNGLPREIIVAHLNHRLRGRESDEDEIFVRELAASYDLKCFVEQINTVEQARLEKLNIESAARRIRYDFFQRVAENCESKIVFTAHTQDDQIETILMRLLRGSGPEGLRGIQEVRPISENIRLMRPILNITHEEVLEHCEFYGITYRIDSSNLSTNLTRNRIRYDLAPMLRSFNPRFSKAFAHTAELLVEDDQYLQQVSAQLFSEIYDGSGLDIKPLQDCHPALRRRVLRIWLRDCCGGLQRIDSNHLAALENLIIRSQSGRSIELPNGRRVLREFDRIIPAGKSEKVHLQPVIINLNESVKQDFGGFKFFLRHDVPRESAEITKIKETGGYIALLRECNELKDVRIRTRKHGDAYVPEGRRHKTKLKTLMIRHKIPLSQRNTYPVLVTADDQIIWAPGLPVARQFAISGDKKEIMRVAMIIAELDAGC